MDTSEEKKWFVHLGDKHEGPLSEHEIRVRITQGNLKENPHVWTKGMEKWLRLSETPLAPKPRPNPSPIIPKPRTISPISFDGPRPVANGNSGTNGDNEMSAFIEMKRGSGSISVDDRTQSLDPQSLKEAKKEAAQITRIQKEAEFSEAPLAKKAAINLGRLIGLLLVAIVAGIGLYFGMKWYSGSSDSAPATAAPPPGATSQ